MKVVYKQDVEAVSNMIVELPPFQELKSKENIRKVLEEFLTVIYIEKPQEVYDVLDFKLSERMQEAFFSNYGIDKNYSRQLKGNIKKEIAYYLETLFQNKGSRIIFKLFGEVFQNIFRKVNFYNIEAYKIPTMEGFRFEYRLDPIYIMDNSNIIKYPQIPIGKTRKYLMDLENFKNYTAWPVPTNLIYIQFSIGEEVVNNMDTFLNGIRSYATSYLTGASIKYIDSHGQYENIYLPDMEFIIQYINLELIRHKNPDITYNYPDRVSSYLRHDPNSSIAVEDFLCALQNLIFDYQDADYRDRNEMESLRRRWQFFLKSRERDIADQVCHLSTLEEITDEMERKYPRLRSDILDIMPKSEEEDHGPLFDFIIKLYATFISGAYANQRVNDPSTPENEGGCAPVPGPRTDFQLQWVIDYIDVIFGGFFAEKEFVDYYFNPVMNLFIRYFFPVEMEYVNDLIKKAFIKDKWNALGTSEERTLMVHANPTSLQTPIRGLDYRKFYIFMTDVHSYVDKIDLPSTITYIPVVDDYPDPQDEQYVTVFSIWANEVQPRDEYEAKIFDSSNNFYTRISYRFYFKPRLKMTDSKKNRTKDYQVEKSLELLKKAL